MKREPKVVITAVICIAIIEVVAIIKGVDGALMAGALAIIGGLAGYGFKSIINPQNKKEENDQN